METILRPVPVRRIATGVGQLALALIVVLLATVSSTTTSAQEPITREKAIEIVNSLVEADHEGPPDRVASRFDESYSPPRNVLEGEGRDMAPGRPEHLKKFTFPRPVWAITAYYKEGGVVTTYYIDAYSGERIWLVAHVYLRQY